MVKVSEFSSQISFLQTTGRDKPQYAQGQFVMFLRSGQKVFQKIPLTVFGPLGPGNEAKNAVQCTLLLLLAVTSSADNRTVANDSLV